MTRGDMSGSREEAGLLNVAQPPRQRCPAAVRRGTDTPRFLHWGALWRSCTPNLPKPMTNLLQAIDGGGVAPPCPGTIFKRYPVPQMDKYYKNNLLPYNLALSFIYFCCCAAN
jgi:hypothetical protein